MDWGEVALWTGAGAVAGLVIVTALPVILASPDSFIDLGSLFVDAAMGDPVSFALDVASLAMPGLPSLGTLNRAGNAIQTVNRLDIFGDAANALRRGGDYFRAISQLDIIGDARRAINSADNFTDTARYASNACNSFSADTEVATDEGDKPISQIQIGDYVLAWDEETNSISFYPVMDTIHHTDEVIVHLTIDGEELETTPEHPFYVEGEGWVNAEDLEVGDDIRNADGETGKVESITTEETSQAPP
ncbi:MAG: Hint domain-containing protein [Chloroflexota bacterium]